jgi:hypothetical protein
MGTVTESTSRGVAFGRLYFAAIGIALLGIGGASLWFFDAPAKWLSGSLVVPGFVSLLYAFSKPGHAVADSARTLLEDFDE